jgi:hypothetical protein
VNIYIDESGTFAVPTNGMTDFCCVGALVIPETQQDFLFQQFANLKKQWNPSRGEIKGSSLDEPKIASVIEILLHAEAILFICATVPSLHSVSEIEFYRNKQADRLTANLTPKHLPELRQKLNEVRDLMAKMSPQEFLQFMILIRAVERILRVTPNHFAFHAPVELGAFKWKIDAKNEGKSALETCWNKIGGGFLQSAFLRERHQFIGGDLRYFDEAFLEEDQIWPDHLPRSGPARQDSSIIALHKILKEHFEFADSSLSPGIQLADIATNSFRRAVRGRLGVAGWGRLGELMLGFLGNAIDLVYLTDSKEKSTHSVPDSYNRVLQKLESSALRIGRKKWVTRFGGKPTIFL